MDWTKGFSVGTVKTEESKYIEMMNGFYKRSGMWRSKTRKEINWIYVILITTLLIIDIVNGCYTFCLNYDNFDITIEVLFFIIISLHSLFVAFNFISKQPTANWTLNTLRTKFNHFERTIFKQTKDVWKSEEKKSILQTKVCFYLIFSTYLMYFYQTNVFYLDPKIRKTLYPLWTPFSMETPMYYAALAFQMMVFYIHINVHIMSAGLFAGSVNLYGAMTDIINRVFQDINSPDEFRLVEFKENHVLHGDGREVMQKYLLKKCIEQHVLLKRFEKELNSLCGMVFLELVFVSELLICFSGYQMVKAVIEVDIKRVLKAIFTMAVMIVQIFVYCWFGEKIYSKSTQFTFNIYCCDWYKCSNSFRRSFRIVLLNTMRDVKISPYGIVSATLNTFVQTLKAAFSFLNLLIVLSTDQPA